MPETPALAHARKIRREKDNATKSGETTGFRLAREDCKQIGVRMIETLATQFSTQDIADVMRDAMGAEHYSKDGEKSWPDARTRLDAVRLYLAYVVGTPIQRQETVNYNFDIGDLNPTELIRKLAESPAMLSKVEEMVSEAKEKAISLTVEDAV